MQRRFYRLILLAAGLFLIIVGAPRFLAAVWTTVGDPVYSDINAGKRVSSEDLELLIESREAVLTFVDSPRAYTDLGIAFMMQDTSPDSIARAIEVTEKGLALAPIAAFSWERLAGLYLMAGDREQDALNAWLTSRALARHDPRLFHDRIRVGIGLYRFMNDEQRAMVREAAEEAYAENRHALKVYGRSARILEWLKLLLRDPEKTKYLSK